MYERKNEMGKIGLKSIIDVKKVIPLIVQAFYILK